MNELAQEVATYCTEAVEAVGEEGAEMTESQSMRLVMATEGGVTRMQAVSSSELVGMKAARVAKVQPTKEPVEPLRAPESVVSQVLGFR